MERGPMELRPGFARGFKGRSTELTDRRRRAAPVDAQSSDAALDSVPRPRGEERSG